MSLSAQEPCKKDFGAAARKKGPTRKHPPPVSVRFTEGERARLAQEAGKLSLSAYIRLRLFGAKSQPPARRTRKRQTPTIDRENLGRVLGLLGQSRLASTLSAIANAAAVGALPVSRELEDELSNACAAIQEMRAWLIEALGVRER